MPSTTSRDDGGGIHWFHGRKVVVVTPVALDSDSRTLKQVMSLTRWGADVTVYADGQLIAGKDIAARPEAGPAWLKGPKKARPGWISGPWGWVRRTNVPVVFLLPVFAAWLVSFYWRTLLVASCKIPAGADLYILHEFGHFPAVSRAAGTQPIVYDAHDFYTQIEPADQTGSFDRHLLAPFSRWLERRCISRSNAMMTVSPGLAQLYTAAYGKAPQVVRNCHDDRLDATGIPVLKDRLKLSSDAFVVVIVGNWKAGQELEPLLRSLEAGRDNAHLALIGGGYHRLDTSIRALGLEGRVHKIGSLPPQEIVPAVSGADAAAVVYYARSENYHNALPNGFFQSVAAGLPVLCPDLPEIRALAEQGDFGLVVDWSDEAAIASALSEVSERTQRRKRLRANAQKAARILSWENEELVFANVLSECLEEATQTSEWRRERPLPGDAG